MDVAAVRHALLDTTDRLVTELGVHLPAGSIIRCVVRCRDELWLLGVRDGIVEAVEAMARRRLQNRLPVLPQPYPAASLVGVC